MLPPRGYIFPLFFVINVKKVTLNGSCNSGMKYGTITLKWSYKRK